MELENINTAIRTRAEIQQSGLMRLSDIFLLIDDWDVSTIDGMQAHFIHHDDPAVIKVHQYAIFANGAITHLRGQADYFVTWGTMHGQSASSLHP